MHRMGRFVVELESGLFVESSHVVSGLASGVGNTAEKAICEEVHLVVER
jgi:hypothetical protein